jgi:hypothetical protein
MSSGVVANETFQAAGFKMEDKEDSGGSKLHWRTERLKIKN